MSELTTAEIRRLYDNFDPIVNWRVAAGWLLDRLEEAEGEIWCLTSNMPKAKQLLNQRKSIISLQLKYREAEAKLKTVKYRHAALIEIYSHENCMNIESVEKRIDVFINEEQSHGDI